MQNWSYWMQNFMEQAFLGYENVFGYLFYPILFTGIIGYVYLKNQSYVAAAVATLIIFAAFGDAFMGVQLWVSLMHILVSLALTGLLLIFLTKIRK